MTTLSIPLLSHEAIVAALVLCDMIGNDTKAVVMIKGYGDDWDHFTGVYLADYELDAIIDDDSWFSDYEAPQLWLTLDRR
jgi:hypothetical protein